MQSAKEAASNMAASAKAGMEKTKAAAEEKAEKMTTRDPLKKEIAEQKKDAKINEAERMKHETRAENVAARHGQGHGYGGPGYTGTGTGGTGYSTGTTDLSTGYAPEGTFGQEYQNQASAGVTRGPVGSEYPAGSHTGTGRTGAQDPRVTGGRTTDYGSRAPY